MAEATRGPALTRTGKTRRKVECIPPNKKCGGRCIPPDWDCRLEGKGTNPELKVVKNDPLAGAASIQRGAKDVAKGVTTLDPAKVERGRNSIIRGIVKITPGNNLEDKKKLRKRLEEGSSAAFALTLVGILGVVGHRSLNNSSFYRERIGRRIDQAAFRAVNAVLDVTPGQRGRRNAIRSAATVAQIQTMRAAQRGYALTTAGQRAAENLGRMGPLGFLGDRVGADNSPLLNDARLRDTMKKLAADAKSSEDFATKATEKLFSTTTAGKHNLFSASSAQSFLNSEFQLGLGSVINPPLQRRMGSGLVNNPAAGLTLANRKEAVIEGLTSRIEQWGGAMRADMVMRGYTEDGQKITPAQITRYIREQALPIVRPYAASMGPNADVALINYERQLRLFIGAGGSSTSARGVARQTYLTSVKSYDTYFADVVDRFSGGPMARSSPFADGKVALAKYLRGSEAYNPTKGTGYTRIVSREHANLLISDWYHRRSPKIDINTRATEIFNEKVGAVRRRLATDPDGLRTAENNLFLSARRQATAERATQKADYIVSPATAQRIAQTMRRSPEPPTPEDALIILRRSGLKVRYAPVAPAPAPRRYGERSEAQILASMMRQTRVNRRGERVPRYTSRAAALRALRAQQQEENRGDSEPGERAGKPCGESHISKQKECHTKVVNKSQGTIKPIQHTNPETGNRTALYRLRQASSLTLRAGATVGGAALTAQQFKSNQGRHGDLNLAMAGMMLSFLGAKSIVKEARTTRSSKELVKEFTKLKEQPGVEARTIDQLTKFVEDAGIDVQRVGTTMEMIGLRGAFTTAMPNRVYSSVGGTPTPGYKKAKGSPEASYSKGIEEMIKARQLKSLGGVLSATSEQDKMVFHGSGNLIGNPRGNAMYFNAHEIAHAMHYRSDFATPKSVKVNGKTYEGQALERELKRSTSIYGLSDLTRTAKGPTNNYYLTGSRLETFAENYAMYVGNGKAMKAAYPVSYEWTRQTADYALSRPTNKPAMKFTDLVKELSNLPDRRYIDRTDARTSFVSKYNAIQKAAVEGDVRTTLELLTSAKTEGFTMEQLGVLSSYLETAIMYAGIDNNKSRTDSGKPCGKTHIPKEKKCHTPVVTKEQIGNIVQTAAVAIYVGGLAVSVKQELRTAKLRNLVDNSISAGADGKYPPSWNSKKLSSTLQQLKSQKGVDPKIIDQVTAFADKAKINVNLKADGSHYPATFGYWNPTKPNTLNVPYFGSRKGEPPTPDMSKVARYGAAAITRPQPLGLFRQWGVSNNAALGSSEQFMMTTIHELGHAIHGRVGFSTPKRLSINGKTYEGKVLTKLLGRSITGYGSTDLRYGRYESFAEYFSMYVTNGETLKRRNPVAWAWTKSIVDRATSVNPTFTDEMLANTMTVVKKTKEGRALGKPMFDAAMTRPAELLVNARRLAIEGDQEGIKAMLDRYEGTLSFEQLAVIGSLYETAGIYAFTKGETPDDIFPDVVEVDID